MGNCFFYNLAAKLYYIIKVLEFRKVLSNVILVQ